MCKKFLRGDPYYSLHISEEGGGAPRECAKLACLVKLYITSQSIKKKNNAALIWVFSMREGGFTADPKVLGHFFVHTSWPSAKYAHRLVVGSLALGQTNPTVCSLDCPYLDVDSIKTIWIHLDEFGSICSLGCPYLDLDSFKPIWIHMDKLG